MAVIINQPGGIIQQRGGEMLLGSVNGHRDWSSSLLACCADCKSLVLTWCCLPCVLCSIASRQGDCMLMPWFVPGSLIAVRARIRTLGGIQGSICGDCVAMSCCALCGICQMQRELDAMGL